MNTERLDQRAYMKVSGPSWGALRPAFARINDALLRVSDDVKGELTTVYIKYSGESTDRQPFGVVWVKSSSQLVIGLSLPESIEHECFVPPPKGCKYRGLTRYIIIKAGLDVPAEWEKWAEAAYEARRSS